MTTLPAEASASFSSLPAMPAALSAAEAEAVRARRTAAGLPSDAGPPIGLAISGGGIRSATFGLGVLQALARAGLLRRFDYLSTVSGGGYVGSFLGRLFSRPKEELRKALPSATRPAETAPLSTVAFVERILAEPLSKPVAFLRENGRYLSPNGAGDLLLAGAVALRNWASIHVVLATLVLTLFLFAQGVRLLVPWPERALHVPPDGGIAWSVWLVLPAISFLFLVVPFGWAYWLGQRKSSRDRWPFPPALGGWLVLAAALLPIALEKGGVVSLPPGYPSLLGAVALVAAIALIASRTPREILGAGGVTERAQALDPARDRARNNRLSRWLKGAIVLTLGTLAFALVDSAGGTLYAALARNGFDFLALFRTWTGALSASGLGALLVFGKKLTTLLAGKAEKERLSLPAEAVASAAALALVVGLLVLFSFLSWGFVHDWALPGAGRGAMYPWILGSSLLVTLLFGRTMPFLNASSFQALYAARISRAYLGASNPARWTGAGMNVTEPIEGDGTAMALYRPHETGGPLHLVNVTLNETVSGESQVEQRDRKGLGMAVGPFGVSVGRRSHALRAIGPDGLPVLLSLDPSRSEYAVFTPRAGSEAIAAEPLALETWVSISGAAFSTGLGSRTSPGLALLCGLFNVRLGYWWDSGMDPSSRTGATNPGFLGRVHLLLDRLIPVQMHLLDECLAQFRGPNSGRWYLTDGGHYENTAAYELIRRRLPLIVVCDDGADPGYQFGDLANLVRKARLDFCTEISFLDGKDLADDPLGRFFGPLDELTRDAPLAFAKKHAALARLTYPDGSTGVLVVLKPTLTGEEPLDLLEYHADHPVFPQEPTGDQFFDEAQWESYRKLGEFIGTGFAEILAGRPLAPETFLRPPPPPPGTP